MSDWINDGINRMSVQQKAVNAQHQAEVHARDIVLAKQAEWFVRLMDDIERVCVTVTQRVAGTPAAFVLETKRGPGGIAISRSGDPSASAQLRRTPLAYTMTLFVAGSSALRTKSHQNSVTVELGGSNTGELAAVLQGREYAEPTWSSLAEALVKMVAFPA